MRAQQAMVIASYDSNFAKVGDITMLDDHICRLVIDGQGYTYDRPAVTILQYSKVVLTGLTAYPRFHEKEAELIKRFNTWSIVRIPDVDNVEILVNNDEYEFMEKV